MATYLIGYDFHPSKGEKYDQLYEDIKGLGTTWWHHLDSTWVVVSSLSAKDIRERLMVHMKSDDQLLIVKSGVESAWHGFNDRGGAWLKKHL